MVRPTPVISASGREAAAVPSAVLRESVAAASHPPERQLLAATTFHASRSHIGIVLR
ncbi:hypothetical protein GZH49_16025 [Nocardia terpenica]|uniref:hypothetical protein n=1 Tax=Nocardia terpenica TaxID=455432 RepID=UPI002FE07461